MTEEELNQAAFRRFNDYRQQIFSDFDEEHEGLSFMSFLFHTKDSANFTKYNGFNFTDTATWDSPWADSFWYSSNTTMLYSTQTYVLGEQSPEEIVLRLQPERLILRNQKPSTTIFGVPISFEDQKMQQVSR